MPVITAAKLGQDLLFTDALYDIGKAGATRPRDGFFSRNLTVGGTIAATGLITASGGVLIDGGTYAAGRLYYSSLGMSLASKTGSAYDFRILKADGSDYAFQLVPGTADWLFGGHITTAAPTGGAGAWKLGIANAVSPTSPNRTLTVDIGGTVYYIHAKTTNN